MKTTKQKFNQLIDLAIVRISTLSFRINETATISNGSHNANVQIGTQTAVDLNNNFIAIKIKVTFHPTEDTNSILMEGDFQTIFAIKDLKNWVNPNNKNEINLPDEVNYTMMNISLSHSRALFANLSANGPFQHLILPILSKEWIEKELLLKNTRG
jgi:hypothetical protein